MTLYYAVGLGDSPMHISGVLSGNPFRHVELLRANPHKEIVYLGATPTFASLGVGEQLIVPASFLGDVFDQIAQTFGTHPPPSGVGALGDFGLGGLGLEGFMDVIGGIGHAVKGAVKSVGHAAGKAVHTVTHAADNAAHAATKAVASAATFVAKTGGDATKFVQDQAEKFAKDPIGQLTKIATTGGLSLVGVSPEKILNQVGIPSPDQMLQKLGLPTPGQIIKVSYGAITNPKELLAKIPGVSELAKYLPDMPDPTKMAANLVNAAVHGDLKAISHTALDIGHQFADVVSMVPGVGNVIGGPLSAAITLLETGSALKAALSLLLAQIPGIPPMIRDLLRTVLNSVADIVERAKSVTDVFLAQFKQGVIEQVKKKGVPKAIAGIVNDFLDGAIQVIFRHKPIDHAALDFAEKGLATAAKKSGTGSAEFQKAQRALTDLKQVYKKTDTIHALTQGVVQLAKKDAQKRDPVTQKKIKDLRATIEGEKLVAQSHVAKVNESLGKTAPPHETSPKWAADLQALAKLTPAQQKQLIDLQALAKLTPEQQRQLVAFKTAQDAAAAAAAKAPPKLTAVRPAPARPAPAHPAPPPAAPALPSAPGPVPAPALPPAAPPTLVAAYAPYPNSQVGVTDDVSAPPHGHGHGGGHGGGHWHGGGHFGRPVRPFARGGGFVPGWWGGPWWGTPWSPEVVTRTETCQTWGEPVEMPPAMEQAARSALGASRGRPTTVRGPDNVLYLFSVEGGTQTARPCAAVAST